MSDNARSKALPAYHEVASSFRADSVASQLQGDLSIGVNACVECCDRHVDSRSVALDWIGANDQHEQYTFAQMRDYSAQVANMLASKGVKAGDVVAGLLPRTPELMATVLGTWRAGAVYQPLFTAFGPKAIEHRLRQSGARLVVTNTNNREKLSDISDCSQIATILGTGDRLPAGDIDFLAATAAQPTNFEPILRTGKDLMLLMFTSGTTGLPKGVPVPLRALLAFATYMRYAVDLRDEDKFWNIADPGWAYGLYFGLVGPLLLGHSTTFFEGAFSVDRLCNIIERLGITSLAGSPTAYRMLMAAGEDVARRLKRKLRVVSSAGEPLNPEVVRWFSSELATPIYDHFGQTELGMVVNNHHGLAHNVHPGSAGYAMPGYRVVVLDESNRELGPGEPGNLAVDIAHSPLLWFEGYWKQDTSTISAGYYRTGDTAEFEPDGTISFVGRADDVITSSGYRIGPYDVESALIEHPAVSEAAVIGVPDPQRTEVVKAFVVLSRGYKRTTELAEELRLHVKRRLSAHAYPRAIEFVDDLPKTPSGKIQRFVLRQLEADILFSKNRREGRKN